MSLNAAARSSSGEGSRSFGAPVQEQVDFKGAHAIKPRSAPCAEQLDRLAGFAVVECPLDDAPVVVEVGGDLGVPTRPSTSDDLVVLALALWAECRRSAPAALRDADPGPVVSLRIGEPARAFGTGCSHRRQPSRPANSRPAPASETQPTPSRRRPPRLRRGSSHRRRSPVAPGAPGRPGPAAPSSTPVQLQGCDGGPGDGGSRAAPPARPGATQVRSAASLRSGPPPARFASGNESTCRHTAATAGSDALTSLPTTVAR